MNNQLTVIIPTSPIPSHPSTEILDETIKNIRNFTDAQIIICFDGVHSSLSHREKDYAQYLKLVGTKMMNGFYGDCKAAMFPEHTHQAEMVRTVLKAVTTPLIFFVEHDTYIKGDIPFQEICDYVEKDEVVNYIRFNIFSHILEEHRYLMLFDSPQPEHPMPLTATIQYSARPNIAKADWYRNILTKYFPAGSKEMIEDRFHGVVIDSFKELKRDIFGMYIYTPPGDQLRSFHSDGRQGDEKIIQA